MSEEKNLHCSTLHYITKHDYIIHYYVLYIGYTLILLAIHSNMIKVYRFT